MTSPPVPQLLPRVDEPPASGDDRRTARCGDLAATLGQLDTDHHLFAGSLLASASTELAAAAGRPWSFDPATPPVVLLRAVAKLSMLAPDTRSRSARVLLDAADITPGGAA